MRRLHRPKLLPPLGRWWRAHRWVRRLGRVVLGMVALPWVYALVFRWVPVPGTPLMLQRWAQNGQPPAYRWVPFGEMSPHLSRAAIASEDQRFLLHYGVDWQAIQKALAERQRRGRLRGGSSISQQVAKNLFLLPSGGWVRKALELPLTYLLELLWPKQRIMAVYLNVAELGPGVFGVGAASQAYFGQPPRWLGPQQAAQLIAVLPSPRRYRAANPGPVARARAAHIRRQMALLPPSWLVVPGAPRL